MRVLRAAGLAGAIGIGALAAGGQPDFIAVNSSPGVRYLTPRFTRRAVGIDSAGGFVAIWQDETLGGRTTGLYVRAFESSGAPKGPQMPLCEGSPCVDGAAVAVSSSGRAAVVWLRPDEENGSGVGVWAQKLRSDGKRDGEPLRVNGARPGRQGKPSVASGEDDGFVVVWSGVEAPNTGFDGISVRRFDAAGAPLTGEIRLTRAADGEATNPSVASLPGGRCVVAYMKGSGVAGELFLQRVSEKGEPMDAPTRVRQAKTTNLIAPSVAASSDGLRIAVAWQSIAAEGMRTFLRIFDGRGRPVTGELSADLGESEICGPPTVSFSGRDRILIAWSSHSDSGVSRLRGRYFFNDGRVEESLPFSIDGGAPGHRGGLSVAANPSGRAVAVWDEHRAADWNQTSQATTKIRARLWSWPRGVPAAAPRISR